MNVSVFTGSRRIGASLIVLALLVVPRDAFAQRDAFVQSLIAFRTALAGNFGDEGPQVTASLAQMATSLTVWDRVVESTEADLRARLSSTSSDQVRRSREELIRLLLDRFRLGDALSEIDAAIADQPDRADLHVLRGLAHEAAGDQAAAEQDFAHAWTLDRAAPGAAYLLAERRGEASGGSEPQLSTLLAAFSARDAAARPVQLDRVALVDDHAADWTVFAPAAYADGFSLVAGGKFVEAVASFRAAAARDPLVTDPALRSEAASQAIASLRAKRFGEAVERLEAVARSSPGSSEAHRLLGAAYGAAGRDAEAVAELQAAVRLAPADERVRIALGRALMRAMRRDEAEQALRDTAARLPQSTEVHLALADLYEQRDRAPDAIAELEAATAFPVLAGKAALYFRLADLYHRNQDFEAVTRILTKRARLDPGRAAVHKDLGLAYMRRGSRRDALRELLMASLLGPDDAETLATIGQIHLDSGEYDAAEPVLRRAVALAPSLAQARFALGTTLVRLGRADEGRAELAEFQRLRTQALEDQRRAFAFEKLLRDADLRSGEGRYDLAAGILRQVVEIEPRDPGHRVALADALTHAGDLEGAVVQLEEAARLNGGASVYQQLASLYGKLGRAADRARAQAAYEQLSRQPPTGASPR